MTNYTNEDYKYLAMRGEGNADIILQCGWYKDRVHTGKIHIVVVNSDWGNEEVVELNTQSALRLAHQLIYYCNSLKDEGRESVQ